MGPLVYIVILNFNGYQDTVECLSSLKKLDYPNYRIILVDNASTDDSTNLLAGDFPDLTLIRNTANLGFAGGNNAGIKYAMEQGADYVFLLNNDTIIDSAAVIELVRAGEADTKSGILGSVIYYYTRPDRIWFASGWINWFTGRTGHYRQVLDEKPYDTDFIAGCALMIKRNVIKDIGLLDEDFFLYFEDTDLCRRAVDKGHKLKVVPASLVWHKVSSSIGIQSPLWQYYVSRNLLLFMSKHNKFPSRQVFFAFYPFRVVVKSLMILFTDRGLLASYIKGNMDYWKGALGWQAFS